MLLLIYTRFNSRLRVKTEKLWIMFIIHYISSKKWWFNAKIETKQFWNIHDISNYWAILKFDFLMPLSKNSLYKKRSFKFNHLPIVFNNQPHI